MTNADVIRSMNDEQLDHFLDCWELGDVDYAVTFCDLCKKGGNIHNFDCDGCRKYWLAKDSTEWQGLNHWSNRHALK